MGCELSKICPFFFKKREEQNIQEAELNHYERLYDREETTKDGSEVRLQFMEKTQDIQELTDLRINVSKLVIERKCSLFDVYEEESKFGSGSFGVVYKVRHKKTGELRAMKKIPKHQNSNVDSSSIEKEIKILRNLDHPHIIKIYEFFQDSNFYYLINEFAELGDLSNIIEDEKYLDEKTVKIIMRQLLSSVAYLHSKNIIHGDLKLENILIDNLKKNPESKIGDRKVSYESIEIKVIDFGCSKIFAKGRLSGVIGTSTYLSPEVIRNNYNEKCDVWSCGVVMYVLLSGLTPFYGETNEQMFDSIIKGKYDFSDSSFNEVSHEAKDLINKLMTYNHEDRCSALEALNHPFLKEKDSSYDQLKLNPSLMKDLKSVKSKMKFHQAVVAYISHNFANKGEVASLRKLFKFLDKDGSGTICKKEILEGYKAFGEEICENTVNDIIKAIDNDNNGYIEYEEFLRSMLNKEKLLTEVNLKLAFDIFDSDQSGEICVNEIKHLIFGGVDMPEKVVAEFLAQINKKPEDMINFEDFKKLMLE